MIRETRLILQIVLPITLGLLIYSLLRYESIFSIHDSQKSWIDSAPNWIKYNLPDGLWLYGLYSAILLVWKDKPSKVFLSWIFICTLISIVLEYLQLYKIIKGTYDSLDIITYFSTLVIFLLSFTNINRKYFKQHENAPK